mmetsp:Transcript_78705/g.204469  ORF Transcript_78705/g.204469 Transcript_78705/m.204469 type:complete len:613 (-) Transcript_78705:76-1914(-)
MPLIRKSTLKHLVLALVSIAATCHATSFLQPAPTSLQDVTQSLKLELADAVDHQRLAELREVLQTTFTALPKDENGHLGHQTVRYVLHRLFVQQHGWFIKGLEPDGDVWHTKSEVASLKDWVPSYLLGQLEESAGSEGVDLDKLAALAAALEDLINREAVDRLTAVYEALDLPTSEPISVADAHKAFLTYLAVYLSGGKFTAASTAFETTLKTQAYAQRYTGWAEVESWLAGMERDHFDSGDAASVPFSLASRVAVEVGKRFGTFNDMECEDLKFTLLGMHGHKGKAGRIRLPDFYKKSLHSHWRFTEKVDYLRALGALDESNASDPMVIIPNYVAARPNCLESAELYAVCCRNECEDLMVHLEHDIAAPTAEPERIAKLVEALGSPTVSTPRHLSEPLLNRLHEVASLHGGEVNIHGRLFAQWMHHAYPNECPYPHEAGSASPVTPDEWIGEDASASEEERHHVVASDPCPFGGCDHHHQAEPDSKPALPWSHTEELLAKAPRKAKKVLSWGRLFFALVLAVLAAATAFFGNSRFVGLVALELRFGLTWQVICLSLLACAAAAVELVNRTILACALVGGVLANLVSTVPASGSPVLVPRMTKDMKTAKCLV